MARYVRIWLNAELDGRYRRVRDGQAGPWRLVRRLGLSGMGEVSLGRAADGSLAAIKVVRDDYANDASFRARFRREIEACSRVHGGRMAELVDVETKGERPWLAVRYVPGPTLDTYVTNHGTLGSGAVTALAIEVADGLAVVWSAGVVHRDLKPSNVIMTPEGPVLIRPRDRHRHRSDSHHAHGCHGRLRGVDRARATTGWSQVT